MTAIKLQVNIGVSVLFSGYLPLFYYYNIRNGVPKVAGSERILARGVWEMDEGLLGADGPVWEEVKTK